MAYTYAILLKRVQWPFQIRCIVGQLRLFIRYSSASRNSPPKYRLCHSHRFILRPSTCRRHPCPANRAGSPASAPEHSSHDSSSSQEPQPLEERQRASRIQTCVPWIHPRSTYFSDYKPHSKKGIVTWTYFLSLEMRHNNRSCFSICAMMISVAHINITAHLFFVRERHYG